MIRVALLIFDEADLLDIGGPYEILITANRLAGRRGENPIFEVVTVSPGGAPVTVYGGLGLTPSMAAEDLDRADLVLVPGAIAIDAVAARPEVQAAVAGLLDRSELAVSVCTGAFLLGDRGLLDDIPWTTHFEDVADLAARIDSDGGRANVRWVDTGAVVTSGGISSGIAMACHLVERFHSRELAEATAAQIEYVWDPEAGVVV